MEVTIMGKAERDGIPLGGYIKANPPEHLVRAALDGGALRYTWIDAHGDHRSSDDGGKLPPQGWWRRPEFTLIDREMSEVREHAPWIFKPHQLFGPMYAVRVFPELAESDELLVVSGTALAEGHGGAAFAGRAWRKRPSVKSALVAEILADFDKPERGGLAPDLEPAEIEKKVLREFRKRWAERNPEDKTERPVSRTVIFRAYQEYIAARPGK
jgi:hypothetical protein